MATQLSVWEQFANHDTESWSPAGHRGPAKLRVWKKSGFRAAEAAGNCGARYTGEDVV